MRSLRTKIASGLLVPAIAAAIATLGAGTASAGRSPILDPTFGHGGRLIAEPPQEPEPAGYASAAQESNGDLLLELHRKKVGEGTARELELRRPDGGLEASFAGDGRLAVGAGKGIFALADGDTLVGVRECDGTPASLMLIDGGGTPVASFGHNGCSAGVGFPVDRFTVDPQGRILIAGSVEYCPTTCPHDALPSAELDVARLLPDGILDRGFGQNGVVGTNSTLGLEAEGFEGRLSVEDLVATSDGGVLISTGTGLIRLDSSGALDGAFGTGGVVTGAGSAAGTVVAQPDGSIELLSVDTLEDALFVSKFGPNGSVEAGFGSDGTARIATPSALQQYEIVAAAAPDGALMVGSREPFIKGCVPCVPSPFLIRLAAGGQPDPSYGEGSVVKIGPSPGKLSGPSSLNALLVASDGSTLVVGDNWEQEALVSAQTADGAVANVFGGSGTLSEHFDKPAQLEPTGFVLRPQGGLLVMNQRSDAPGEGTGYLLDFDRDGKQLQASDGSPAVRADVHGTLIPVAGGFVVWDKYETQRLHVINAIGPDGAPLARFGTKGAVTLPHKFFVEAIEATLDGGCILIGDGFGLRKGMAIYRLGPDGKPLKSFGHDGLAFAFRGRYAFPGDASVEADGDTVITGSVNGHAAVAQLRPDGKLDRGFGREGTVTGLLGEESSGERIAAWPGGGVVISAFRESASHEKSTSLIRLDRHGDRVRGFGGHGIVRAGAENPPLDLLVTGGRIVVVTNPNFEGGKHSNGVEVRAFLAGGDADRRFARGGIELYGRGGGGEEPVFTPDAAVPQAGGKVVVAGTRNYGHGLTKAALVRFLVP